MKDFIALQTAGQLETWSDEERALFEELLEDAATPLQREMLVRAVAAQHSAAEVHAFADSIRGLDDKQVYATCTLPAARAKSMMQRLQAEADPLYAFTLNGGSISPREARQAVDLTHFKRNIPAQLLTPDPAPLMKRGKPLAFDSGDVRPQRVMGRPDTLPDIPPPSDDNRLASDLFNQALKPLGITFKEVIVETGPQFDQALKVAATALSRGVPIPMVIGRKDGDLRRYVLALQTSTVGTGRSFQLHDPFVPETVWVHENTLRARAELPFEAKQFKCVTALGLPDPMPPKREAP